MPQPEVPGVSLVVTVKDMADEIEGLLADVAGLDWPDECLQLVLVDAFSSDGTWPQIQEFAAEASFDVAAVQKEGRIGAGRNEGFRLAAHDLVAVTDADMRVPRRWLHELVAGMDEPDIGVVGGPNDSATDDLVSRTIACIPVHGPSLGIVPILRGNKYTRDYTTDSDVYACVTRNSLFRREAFDAAGGFDEGLIATEDPELNRRILDEGYRLRYRRAAGVRHVQRETLGAFHRQQRNYAVGQVHANRRHPGMRSVKQVAPSLGCAAFLVTLLFGLVDVRLLLVPAALAAAAVLFVVYYAVRCAIVKRDPALLVTVPLFVLAWQFAWVVGYPKGTWEVWRAR